MASSLAEKYKQAAAGGGGGKTNKHRQRQTDIHLRQRGRESEVRELSGLPTDWVSVVRHLPADAVGAGAVAAVAR